MTVNKTTNDGQSKKPVGITKVAQKAGVSISTVSNVLNNSRYVSPDVAQRVQRIARELGYEPNPIAKRMKNAKSHIIGVVVNDLYGVFTQYILKGINEIAAESGYTIIASGIKMNGATSQEREMNMLQQYVNSNVDGIILSSSARDSSDKEHCERIIELANKFKYTPVVSLERDYTPYGIDSVFFDGYSNARIAVKHLVDCGCKNICHISGPSGTQNAGERINGYRAVLDENGIPFKSSMIATGDYSHRGGYLAMKQLLDNNQSIDGVFCANDQMGVGALMIIKEYGRVVPDDIKVIGYDDIFVSSILEPSLSTIHIAKHHAGNDAARIVIDRINSKDSGIPPHRILLEGRLVVRKSTVATAADDWILTDW